MFKKFMVVILAAMLVVLSACSNSSKQTSATNQDKVDLPKLDSFNWQAFKGQQINVMLNQHPYADAIIKRLPEFEQKTGIKVKYSVTPEDSYFDKLTTALNAQNGNPDVFMTGAYQIWEYAPAGYVQSLTPFLKDKNRVAPDYDFSDFIPSVVNALKWDLQPGHKVGSGDQWALPLGYETNVLLYNKKALAKAGISAPPTTFDEMAKDAVKLNGWNGQGSYGIGLRGTRSWATIHPGYMTAFTNNGGKDFKIQGGKLVSQLDSSASVDITKKFADMIKAAGPKDWSNYTWYQVSTDLGAGKAAMAYDADNFAFYNDQPGAAQESGNIAIAPPPASKDGSNISSNMWVWSISMNKSSKHKDAAWLFMQYFTSKEHMLYGATKMTVVDPARQSVWDNADFKQRISSIEGYEKTFNAIKENATVEFTPQPEFFNTTTEWASALQDIVNGAKPEERLKTLADKINQILSRVKVQ